MSEKICVIGLGTIGLPAALHISNFFDVTGYDVSLKAVEEAQKVGLTSTVDKMPHADIYVITVSTNINTDSSPDLSNLDDVFSKITKSNPQALICIESTVPVSTCRNLSEKFLLKKIVHCPHRYWVGDNVNYGIVQTRVFGALNEESVEAGRNFYKRQMIPIIEVSSIEVAEMSKVVENAYRFVQISFAEELKTIVDHCGLPFDEIRDSCNTKWNIEILEARDGIEGHCLPKDVRYLWNILKSPLLDGAINADKMYKKLKREE